MISRPFLTIVEADQIMASARATAEKQGVSVTICIVDAGGHLQRLDRMDGASLISLRVAEGKARTAVELKTPTAALEQAVASLPSMIAIENIYPFRGGVPLHHDGHCLGAIGVSGALPDQDEKVALSGAQAFAP